jgi:hypothetical protein
VLSKLYASLRRLIHLVQAVDAGPDVESVS